MTDLTLTNQFIVCSVIASKCSVISYCIFMHTCKGQCLCFSDAVSRGLGEKLLPHYREASGSGSGVPWGGGAHFQPRLRAIGPLRWLLWR